MKFEEYRLEALKTLHPDADPVYLFSKLMIEAAEAAQHIIKGRYHGKPVDYAKVKDELGDSLWYLNAACDVIGTTLGEIAEDNIAKLRERHGTQYNPTFYRTEASDHLSNQTAPGNTLPAVELMKSFRGDSKV